MTERTLRIIRGAIMGPLKLVAVAIAAVAGDAAIGREEELLVGLVLAQALRGDELIGAR